MILIAALRNLNRNRRRTLTILLTIAIGTCGIFLFHGFNTGMMNQYRDNVIRARYGNGQINLQGYRDKIYEKPWQHWISNWNDLRTRLSGVPGVVNLYPRISFPALLQAGNITMSGLGQGIDGATESQFFTTLNVEEGKLLTDEEDGIILGKGLARSLDVHLGDRVTVLSNTIHGSINGVDLKVVGIFHLGAKDFDDVVFRLPIRQAQTLLDTDLVESVAVGLNSTSDWPGFAAQLHTQFPNLEATSFDVLDKVYYQHSVDWLNAQFRAILVVVLVIVLFGILNTVSSAVLERKQEIGNLRANGESRLEIMQLLLLEGAALGALASCLGLALAAALVHTVLAKGVVMPPAPGITRQFPVFIELQPAFAGITLAMGIACALLGTLLAGRRVVNTGVAELLRSV